MFPSCPPWAAGEVIRLTWSRQIPHGDSHAQGLRHGTVIKLPQAGRKGAQVLMLDSTKAPAGKKSRGTDVFLPVGLTGRWRLDGRPAVGGMAASLLPICQPSPCCRSRKRRQEMPWIVRLPWASFRSNEPEDRTATVPRQTPS